MNFIKKFIGNGVSKSSDCCGVEIKEIDNTQAESCCGSSEVKVSCCGTANKQQLED
jgi:hypothetical protein